MHFVLINRQIMKEDQGAGDHVIDRKIPVIAAHEQGKQHGNQDVAGIRETIFK